MVLFSFWIMHENARTKADSADAMSLKTGAPGGLHRIDMTRDWHVICRDFKMFYLIYHVIYDN